MSALTDPSEIRRLLDTYGFRFSKSLGQNFLIDASVPERIADSVDSMSTGNCLMIDELVVVLLGYGVENGHTLFHDLRSYTVA